MSRPGPRRILWWSAWLGVGTLLVLAWTPGDVLTLAVSQGFNDVRVTTSGVPPTAVVKAISQDTCFHAKVEGTQVLAEAAYVLFACGRGGHCDLMTQP